MGGRTQSEALCTRTGTGSLTHVVTLANSSDSARARAALRTHNPALRPRSLSPRNADFTTFTRSYATSTNTDPQHALALLDDDSCQLAAAFVAASNHHQHPQVLHQQNTIGHLPTTNNTHPNHVQLHGSAPAFLSRLVAAWERDDNPGVVLNNVVPPHTSVPLLFVSHAPSTLPTQPATDHISPLARRLLTASIASHSASPSTTRTTSPATIDATSPSLAHLSDSIATGTSSETSTVAADVTEAELWDGVVAALALERTASSASAAARAAARDANLRASSPAVSATTQSTDNTLVDNDVIAIAASLGDANSRATGAAAAVSAVADAAAGALALDDKQHARVVVGADELRGSAELAAEDTWNWDLILGPRAPRAVVLDLQLAAASARKRLRMLAAHLIPPNP